MRLFARTLLLICGVLLLAHYLPAGYWLLAAKMRRPPVVYYSIIAKDFMFYRYTNQTVVRVDTKGKTYEREEFERLLPLDNWIQLLRDGKLPESIEGVKLTNEALRRERMNFRIRPVMLDSPMIKLTPLLDAESGRVRLEMPDDFMRLGSTIEFINAQANVVEREKSALFQRAFAAAGFVFPATLIGGNPSTMKPYDEGYFAADAKGATFHIRMTGGQPKILRVAAVAAPEEQPKWETLKPRYYHVQEQDNREIHAIILDQRGQVWFAVGEKYRLVQIPLKRYDPAKMSMTVRGDLLNRLVCVTGDDYVEAVVLNRDYALVDRYTEELPRRASPPAGKVARTLFPVTLRFDDVSSGYMGVFPEYGSRTALWISGGLLAGLLVWLRRRKQLEMSRAPDILAVALGGLCGAIMVFLLPRPE
jgi:hypothetical protein